MRRTRIALFFGILALHSNPVLADLDVTRLKQARNSATTPAAIADFNSQAKAFSEASCFSVLQSQYRVKLPGSFRPYLELGFHAFKVDNEHIKNLVDTTGTTPDFFHGIIFRTGLGLPFGFTLEGGTTQTFNDHPVGGIFLSVSNQVVDFANLVYVDLVPSVTLTGTVMRTVSGPGLYSFTGQSVIGGYIRQTLAQFGFIVQYSYTLLVALDPTIGNHFLRYGFMSQLPLYKGTFLKMEVFYPSVSANLSAGFQF